MMSWSGIGANMHLSWGTAACCVAALVMRTVKQGPSDTCDGKSLDSDPKRYFSFRCAGPSAEYPSSRGHRGGSVPWRRCVDELPDRCRGVLCRGAWRTSRAAQAWAAGKGGGMRGSGGHRFVSQSRANNRSKEGKTNSMNTTETREAKRSLELLRTHHKQSS
jgi:hypothetical protein